MKNVIAVVNRLGYPDMPAGREIILSFLTDSVANDANSLVLIASLIGNKPPVLCRFSWWE